MGSEFSVNTDHLINQSRLMTKQAAQLQCLSDELGACRAGISMKGFSSIALKLQIAALQATVLDHAAKMRTFGEAAQEIAKYYADCEKIITDYANGIQPMEIASTVSTRGKDKRSNWDKFMEWLRGKKIDSKYAHTSREQEKAADAEFKRKIEKVSQKKRFSEETWAKASVKERKKILTEYMKEIEKILGIDVRDRINWTDTGPTKDNTINLGSYNDFFNRVSINEYILREYDPEDSYQLFTTIVHEMRHAYQHAAIEDPTKYQVSQETINEWKKSFSTYQKEAAKGYDSYRNIVVERDAREFAGQD